MKRSFLGSLPAVAVMFFALPTLAQNKGVAVNNDGRPPHISAILDVSSNYPGSAVQKGMLIPRLDLTQRNNLGAVAGLPEGLTIYQTNNTPGFYVVHYGQWFRMDVGSNGWNITGNNITSSVNDFFGTRDNTDLVFRANNLQTMRVEGTPGTRYTHIGTLTTTPNEQLDVDGAIRIYNASPGLWNGTNPNVKYAATNTQGTIHFRPIGTPATQDSLESTFNPTGWPTQQNRDIVMWNGHWGNVNGTAPSNLNLATANAGGWTRLENEYQERFTKAYTQQGTPTCGAGTAELSHGSALNSNGTTPVNTATALLMNPFKYDLPQRRWRSQYLFLKSELNVESNQLGGNPAATGGLCEGSAINQLSFWVNQAVAANNPQRTLQVTVTVKHAPLGTNTLTAFENSWDPAAGCFTNNAYVFPAVGAAGWRTFPLSPFIWDGQRNVIVEIAVTAAAGGGGLVAGGLPVRYSNTTANLTYSSYTSPLYPAGLPCTGAPAPGTTCNPAHSATGMGDCNANGGAFGATNYRPVVQFGGQVATAPAATSGQNSMIWYNGGLISEVTPGWGRQIAPYYAFRGPGTISAEMGVYDNGTLLNDHVFDRAFDGAVSPTDAPTFGSGRNLSIEEMADHTRMNRHLPTMKGRESWRIEKGFSLGDLTNQLWTTAETQALYVTELNDQLNVLEVLSNDRPLSPEETGSAKASIRSLKRYTDAEKAELMKSIDERTVTTNQR